MEQAGLRLSLPAPGTRASKPTSRARLLGADLVEFIPSPHPQGCDLTAAKLAVKVLAWWQAGRHC